LTGLAALTTADLCERIARVTGKPVERRPASDDDYLASCQGVPEEFAKVLLSIYWAVRDGFFDQVTGDIEELTGKPPETFEAYLKRRLGA